MKLSATSGTCALPRPCAVQLTPSGLAHGHAQRMIHFMLSPTAQPLLLFNFWSFCLLESIRATVHIMVSPSSKPVLLSQMFESMCSAPRLYRICVLGDETTEARQHTKTPKGRFKQETSRGPRAADSTKFKKQFGVKGVKVPNG